MGSRKWSSFGARAINLTGMVLPSEISAYSTSLIKYILHGVVLVILAATVVQTVEMLGGMAFTGSLV